MLIHQKRKSQLLFPMERNSSAASFISTFYLAPKPIIPRWYSKPPNLYLTYGISNEIEDVTSNHKHLSEPEYRYNLRYNTRGNDNSINYLSLLIRTPNHQLPASAHILILTLKTNKRKSLIRVQQCSIGLRYGTLRNIHKT